MEAKGGSLALTGAAATSRRERWWIWATRLDPFVLLYLAAVYTNAALWHGQQLVIPAPAPLLVCLAFFTLRPAALTRRLMFAWLGLLSAVLLVCTLTLLRIGAVDVPVLLTTASFTYSLLVGLGGFAIVTAASRARLGPSLATFAGGLLIGAVLDALGPLRPIGDAFRATAYPNWLQYGRDGVGVLRDAATYGGYRPTVFAAEPSLVGIWGLVGISAWLMLEPVRLWSRRTAIYLTYTVAMLALVRTPTLTLAAPILLVAWWTQGTRRSLGRATATWLSPLRFVAVAAGLAGAGRLAAGLSARGALAFVGGPSFYERIVAPQILAGRVLVEHPLLGIGLGDKETLWALTQRLLVDTAPGAEGLLEGQESAIALLCNSFYLHWIYFGSVGGAGMILAYATALKWLGVRDATAVGCVAVGLMFTLGGYTGVAVWSIVMLVAGVRWKYEQHFAAASAPVWRTDARRRRRYLQTQKSPRGKRGEPRGLLGPLLRAGGCRPTGHRSGGLGGLFRIQDQQMFPTDRR